MNLLLVDIGNSDVVIAVTPVIREDDTFVVHRVATRSSDGQAYVTCDDMQREITLLLTQAQTHAREISSCIMASVVPQVSDTMKSVMSEYMPHCPMHEIRPDTQTFMRVDYDAHCLGADRLVNAYAASILYGTPAIVVDVGTGATIDAVSKHGVFEGGIIFPGIFVCADVLHTHTAQLPRVVPKQPEKLVGKNTEECMQSGLYHQCLGGIVHAVEAMKQLPHYAHAYVILTGGYSTMFKHEPLFNACDPLLTLKGLTLMVKNHEGVWR